MIYVDKMERRFRYNFVAGDPKIQYSILQKNFGSFAIISEAIKKNQIALVKHFLNDADQAEDMGLFIILAIQADNLEILKYLIQNSFDEIRFKEFALWKAANYGKLDLVKYLIKSGARPNIYDPIGQARLKGHEEIARYLESNLS